MKLKGKPDGYLYSVTTPTGAKLWWYHWWGGHFDDTLYTTRLAALKARLEDEEREEQGYARDCYGKRQAAKICTVLNALIAKERKREAKA